MMELNQYRGGDMRVSVVGAMILLAGCSEGTPLSPSGNGLEEAAFSSNEHRSRIAVEVFNQARLMRSPSGQRFVEIRVRARCPTGYEQLEEPLTLTQGELAFGQGGFGMTCTGRWERRTFRVFSTGDVEFRRGAASFNVALVVENPATGDLLRATDSGRIRLR
jgi:hypothetical protein